MAGPAPDDVRDPRALATALEAYDYLPDEGLATAVFLALKLQRPLLLEGDAGVGKTEVAKVLARWTGGELLRLQCYEGLDVGQAVYEWDYSRQLLHLRAAEAAGAADGAAVDQLEDELYDERFLVRRPLLEAVRHREGPPPVLLIDEVDRADDEFEAFLLEVLSDYTVTVPELGTFHADTPPIVVITSNRTRDVHDALKRRCLYHWVEHPEFEREVAIVGIRVPGVGTRLARQVAAATEALRGAGLYKPPGVAETIDWAAALSVLGAERARRRHRRRLPRDGPEVPRGPAAGPRLGPRRPGAGGRPARRMTTAEIARDPATVAVAFVRTLRQAGLVVPVDATSRFVEALDVVDVARPEDVYWAGRATLVRRAEDVWTYGVVFAGYFGGHPVEVRRPAPPQTVAIAIDDPDVETADADEGGGADGAMQVRFSRVETLRHADFAALDAAELAEAWALIDRLRLVGSPRPSRRPRPSRSARGRHDLRRTVRNALRAGGEPIRPAHTRPGERFRRVVFLLDVSGSMEPYARALLRFTHAAVVARTNVEAFAVGTRLTRMTRQLSQRDPDAALGAAAAAIEDFSGGTRLGEGLRAFNDEWGQRGMARGAVAVILSDGWDRGDPEQLAEQMARLSRVAHRVVWVNPLKASPGYAPIARGMAAALPFVDAFVEGHSVDSLERLGAVVAGRMPAP